MKNVQNEHFQVESLNKKFQSSKVHIWGPTHNLMNNVQNEQFDEHFLTPKPNKIHPKSNENLYMYNIYIYI